METETEPEQELWWQCSPHHKLQCKHRTQPQSQLRMLLCMQPSNHQGIDLVMGLVMGLVMEMEVQAKAKDLVKALALALANWYQPHLQPTASPGSQTKHQLPERGALQIESQCCPLSHTWCHSEGKTIHQAALKCSHRTHQEFSTKRERQQLRFQSRK
jgi:hypothetical protein